MQQISLTPFGLRPVSAGLLATQARAQAAPALPSVDKWTLLNNLRAARASFGVTDRGLMVLNALLTFLPARTLEHDEPLVVFPSNAALCDRAHGMAESTLRRHLAALVSAGLITRHDSPNGKRYAARDRSNRIVHAFGFDLRPLLVLAADISEAAEAAADAALTLRRLREAVVLKLRDIRKLVEFGVTQGLPGDWQAFQTRLIATHHALRRKMPLDKTADLDAALGVLLGEIRLALHETFDAPTDEMSANDARNERHHTNTEPDDLEFESAREAGQITPDAPAPTREKAHTKAQNPEPALPLGLVLRACPDILPYAACPIRRWPDLVATAGFVHPMMGISASAWAEARQIMGDETAAIVIASMLQRIDAIQKPGGYLRSLSQRAAEGSFSPGPMIMALLNTENLRAA